MVAPVVVGLTYVALLPVLRVASRRPATPEAATVANR
jgi:hypothetical protein